jgi:hypothetical protein
MFLMWVEWYCLWTSANIEPICSSPRYVSIEHRYNDIDRVKPNITKRSLSQYHFLHHKSHMDWPEREPGPPLREVYD